MRWFGPNTTATLAGAVLVAVAGLVAIAPWTSPPSLSYETVSGYPMRVYYRNIGQVPERVSAVAGMPFLAYDRPLPADRIDGFFAELKGRMQASPTAVRPGDYVRWEIADPEGLALKPAKTERATWFYVFAMVESPRAALVKDRWIGELCLVARTREAFKPCGSHNAMYPG